MNLRLFHFHVTISEIYVPISKSQLNSDVNSRANFQEMQIPLCFTWNFRVVVTRIQN